MKLKDVMRCVKCGALVALFATGLTAFAAELEAVRLWEGGPYWATSNLGESDCQGHSEYGALYKFDDADAAVKQLLGPEWRLPTEAEFKKLIDGTVCSCAWSEVSRNSLTIRGQGAYSSRSITLPAGGYDYGEGLVYPGHWGNYWASSTIEDLPDYFYRSCLVFDVENKVKVTNLLSRD